MASTPSPLPSSSFFGSKFPFSLPTPETIKSAIPFAFISKNKLFTTLNIINRKPSSSQYYRPIPSQLTLAALLFSSLAPQAFAIDNAAPPTLPPVAEEAQVGKGGTVKKGKFERVRFSKDGSALQLIAVDGRNATVEGKLWSRLQEGIAMQGGSSGIGYGLKYQARCIADVKADTDHTSFITGTLSLKEENEVHLIRLSSGGTELICEGLFSHPSEIWDLASCPFDQRIFSTVFSTGESFGAAVWQIPELYGELNSPQLERITSLDAHDKKMKCILWWPSGKHDKLISVDEENIILWSLDCARKSAQVQSKESAGMLHYLFGGAWDPHDVNVVAATSESSVQFWDLRSMKNTNSIDCAYVRNVDYNPKKKHILVTAEDETGICIWDLRKPKYPVQELSGHTHWTWAVCCNPEYDGLILSAGTDSTVNLWSASVSGSDELKPDSPIYSPNRRVDPLLTSYSDYEDSVYGLAWSYREPWIFASLSYDGRVVVESIKPFISRK